ncbi:MAG TPA: hypothetical protein V6D17_00250 [Candidatus Obscuribacterales bacterium]
MKSGWVQRACAIALTLLIAAANFALPSVAAGNLEGVRASILDFEDDPWKYPGH